MYQRNSTNTSLYLLQIYEEKGVKIIDVLLDTKSRIFKVEIYSNISKINSQCASGLI